MKRIKHLGILALMALLLASCSVHVKSHGNNDVPPGQMKKVTGSKSAKPYAPGQQKKHAKKHKH
ncbi:MULTISPECIES: hypothetical protein [Myroides]|uniref:Quinol oxidase subunit 4 n=1 Tax=Myroides profundi TaxID=480520 RepID=A0AAJ4W7M2_MYRPR|nr:MULTISPECIES: hypothetical protein [Myroides]AJH14491.1 hypothetical protein MPR_1309 [Myroides profundi]MDM1381932.1 hypothetical protein [Myroides marinus]SER58899.1 hypothetical protein SAMN04488089_12036 [Myroides profundi]